MVLAAGVAGAYDARAAVATPVAAAQPRHGSPPRAPKPADRRRAQGRARASRSRWTPTRWSASARRAWSSSPATWWPGRTTRCSTPTGWRSTWTRRATGSCGRCRPATCASSRSDCRTGTARRAEYFDLDQRVVLSGNARVWQEDNVVSGESVTIYLSQDRSVVQGGKQERVKAIFYPKERQGRDGQGRDRRGQEAAGAVRELTVWKASSRRDSAEVVQAPQGRGQCVPRHPAR